ncbi:protease inhibitor I42 family protein [Nocardia sp. NPDC050712]|uniref:protease inhibitor I42 family protein n=1 Tax=Nocardia sp. NPDC050712 TaxID=3155518 RepID=UPI0033DDECE0
MRRSLVLLLLGLTVACGADGGGEHADHTSATPPATPTPVSSAASATAVPPVGTVTVTEADNGQERRLEAGQRLIVRLASNPSTGYSWQLAAALDQNVVRQIGDREYVSEEPVMPGAPGTEQWTFTAVAAGVTQVRMDYARPWEQGVEPAQTFSLVLVVV